ncbi:MAG: winged helix DNA-binding domain-containing protein [Chloroflexi bacterium]|nr:winged helix DNA-binding domain-containing protein [Chloroflexota bacterium]
MLSKISLKRVEIFQDRTFRHSQEDRLKTIQDAIDFVNERGFIFFWPVKNVSFPSLWCATAGQRPVPSEHDDPGHITWNWKDQSLDKRIWYYGRILKKRNTIISLKTLPSFYALSPNYGSPEEDVFDQYQQGLLSLEAREIFQTLLEKGPLDTLSLRRESHLSGSNALSPFNRAMDLLQRDLRILPTGIAETGRWGYAFVYDLTHRYYPDLLEEARMISESSARSHLVTRYLSSVGAAKNKEISSIFGWPGEITDRTVNLLIKKEILFECSIEDHPDEIFLCVSELLAPV